LIKNKNLRELYRPFFREFFIEKRHIINRVDVRKKIVGLVPLYNQHKYQDKQDNSHNPMMIL